MYEIVDPNREGPDVLATADSIPELFNAVIEIARGKGWETEHSDHIRFGGYYLSADCTIEGPSHINVKSGCPTLTLTPPPKDPMQEWRERRPVKPAFLQNVGYAEIVEYNKDLDRWLSEMPERGQE